jgi:hypothetical protein
LKSGATQNVGWQIAEYSRTIQRVSPEHDVYEVHPAVSESIKTSHLS